MKTRIFPFLVVAGTRVWRGPNRAHRFSFRGTRFERFARGARPIGSGRASEAKQLLEQASNRSTLPSESAVFLAYLQEKSGNSELARENA
jgi:hypothetical protein